MISKTHGCTLCELVGLESCQFHCVRVSRACVCMWMRLLRAYDKEYQLNQLWFDISFQLSSLIRSTL